MKRLRFVLALAGLAAAAIIEVGPAPALAEGSCRFSPGTFCEWHCTNPCEAGCCGDWHRYSYIQVE